MLTIDVRELKQQISKILRQVREDGEVITITHHGEAVAHLVPANPPKPTENEMAAILTDLNHLSAEISAQWPQGVSAVDAITNVRREL